MALLKSVSERLRFIQLVLLTAAVFGAGFVVGTQSGITRAQSASQPGEELFQPLLETYAAIEEQYVDPYGREVQPEALLDGAISGMVDALDDQYSGYMNPEAYALSNSDLAGEFEGIGVVIRDGDNGIEVVGVMEGTPAAEVGVRVGDVFIEVDGVNVTEDNNLELATKVRGPAGTSVTIMFKRGDELLEFDITRARIDVPNITSNVVEGTNFGYIRLNQFTAEARAQINQALADLDINSRDGLIFDLRGNYGGLLSSAIEVGSAFIESGPIVIEDFGDSREETVLNANGTYSGITVPIVVLVDETSASASELVAGALQDLDVATIVGETTLGKGTVQVWSQLSNGGGIRITIARWLTPNRQWIHGEGITPDIVVEWTPEDTPEGAPDPQLAAAVSYLQSLETIPQTVQQVQ
jgi:carboxyl-terminal processing protease